MAFFGGKKEESSNQEAIKSDNIKNNANTIIAKDNISTPTKNLSALRETLEVKADIEGKGSLIIGGNFNGNVKMEDTVFVEKGAKFSGIVHAKNVKISGEFSGTIYSTATEVTSSGKFSGVINTNKAFFGGVVDGVVVSIDSISISESGSVDAKECKSKQIKVEGKVKGRVIASELLEVTSGGSIEGDIITKGIRTEQGGTIIGNIQTYDDNIHSIDSNDLNKSEDDIAKLININPDDIQKYAKKDSDEKGVKRIPADK